MDDIARRIDAACRTGRHGGWGWRHLNSPLGTLRSPVAVIGLNPGCSPGAVDVTGRLAPERHAFVHESWKGRPPGREALQVQYARLCAALGTPAEDTLCFNLIPFRSPSIRALPNLAEATAFGREVAAETLARSAAARLVLFGWQAADALGVEAARTPAGWGRASLGRGRLGDRDAYVLPHLSTFKLFSRPESRARAQALLAGRA